MFIELKTARTGDVFIKKSKRRKNDRRRNTRTDYETVWVFLIYLSQPYTNSRTVSYRRGFRSLFAPVFIIKGFNMISEKKIMDKIAELKGIANNPKKYGLFKVSQSIYAINILEWVLLGD